MRRNPKAVILLLTLCSACAGDTKGAQASQAEPASQARAAAPATATVGACALLLKADVDAAFAPRVFTLEPQNGPDIAGTDRMASVSHCTYASRGASIREMMTVGLVARQAQNDASGITVATAKAGAVKLNATPVDVAGLGDAAYWINLGSARRPIIELNVFKGARTWLVFGASAPTLDTDTALADLRKVAEAALARL